MPPQPPLPHSGDPVNSTNGWNFFTRQLHTRAPQSLRKSRRAARRIDTLVRTGR